jgi:hypothetical protein
LSRHIQDRDSDYFGPSIAKAVIDVRYGFHHFGRLHRIVRGPLLVALLSG